MNRYPRALAKLNVRLSDPSGRVLERDRELTIAIEPRRCDWVSDEPGVADTCTIETDWRFLPIDPRMISDLQIALYADDVGGPDRVLDQDEDELRFLGYVDLPSLSIDSNGTTLTLEARDYSGRLRDTPLRARRIVTDTTLSQALVDMASEVPGYVKADGAFALDVVVEGDDPKIKDVTGRSRWAPPDNARIWDAMQALCREVGLTCEIDRARLLIRPPRAFGQDGTRRLLNPERFAFERSLQPGSADSVEFRCLSTTSRRILSGRFPRAGTNPRRGGRIKAQGDGKRKPRVQAITETVRTFLVPGHFDVPQLEALAEAAYRRSERRQAEGTIETRSMLDIDGASMPGLRAGMAVYVDVREREDDPRDRVRVLGYTQRELTDLLTARGMDAIAADQFAFAWTQAEDAAPIFYVRRARHTMDSQSGYRLVADIEAALIAA